MGDLPTVTDVRDAADRIRDHVKRTPLLRCAELDRLTGGHVLLKAECLQHTGSFKLRGATNRLAHLSNQERRAGVVAWSSGNHAQGVAAAAQQLEVSAKIVMPTDAPQTKIDGTKMLGGEIVFYDRATEDREAIGRRIAEDEGRVLVPSYDDPSIICGQGTVGLEMADQAESFGLVVDDVLVPVLGGGLIAGVGLAVKDRFPNVSLYSVEPKGFDDHRRSLLSGKRETNYDQSGSLCDALLAPTPGMLTWAINREQLTAGYAVNEQDALAAMAFAHRHLNLRVEPGGAAALAAVLNGSHTAKGRCVALVISGGNVDDEILNRAVSLPPVAQYTS